MGECGDTVMHASKYHSFSLAVSNDSAAALCLPVKPRWSLTESCQGNGEWNKSTVSCQDGWERLGGSKTGDREFTEQIFRSAMICMLHKDTCIESGWVGMEQWSKYKLKSCCCSAAFGLSSGGIEEEGMVISEFRVWKFLWNAMAKQKNLTCFQCT